uniref:(northern house mosquito) hypothetical protein n=1 Tax=Culex pipiens TaxID=7175 RepID=A0A8D8JR48_CULPI
MDGRIGFGPSPHTVQRTSSGSRRDAGETFNSRPSHVLCQSFAGHSLGGKLCCHSPTRRSLASLSLLASARKYPCTARSNGSLLTVLTAFTGTGALIRANPKLSSASPTSTLRTLFPSLDRS